MSQTITEALAEIKTINKRLAKKRQFVQEHLFRQERFKDPLVNDGGSKQAIDRERQAIGDLEERVVHLRRAIQDVNEQTSLSVNGTTRNIADWLVWRREVAPQQSQFLDTLNNQILAARREAQQKGVAVVSGEVKASSDSDLVINIDLTALSQDREGLEEVLGTLDGQLSLKNATTFVD